MRRPTITETYLDWKNFDENNENLLVCGIRFDHDPPYMEVIDNAEDKKWGDPIKTYFYRLPKALAYYAVTHVGYTNDGIDRHVQEGRRQLQDELRQLLGIKEDD